MTWRSAFWWFFALVGLCSFLFVLIGNWPGYLIWALALSYFAVAIVIFQASRFWFGVARHIRGHVGSRWTQLEADIRTVPARDRATWYRVLESRPRTNRGLSRMGLSSLAYNDDDDDEHVTFPMSHTVQDLVRTNPERVPLQYASAPVGPRQTIRVPQAALYLLYVDLDGQQLPYVAVLNRTSLEIAAADGAKLNAIWADLDEAFRQQSVYRGRVISLRKARPASRQGFSIDFFELPEVAREDIILPAAVWETLDRNVLGMFRQGASLRRAGHVPRQGVLLYGPPGTGKSLVVRYLVSASKPATVLYLTGRQLSLVRETIQLARMLAPSLVILEDVDLIAVDRRRGGRPLLLHDLMDELDGLTRNHDIVFLLTTNRPEVLEPALVARPGRVDQAIEFPLPDQAGRRELLARSLRQTVAESLNLDDLAARVEGASPAFLEAWARRAILFASERQPSSASGQLALTHEDFAAALREMLERGGSLTRQLFSLPGPRPDA